MHRILYRRIIVIALHFLRGYEKQILHGAKSALVSRKAVIIGRFGCISRSGSNFHP
jgi:hypothetical protein